MKTFEEKFETRTPKSKQLFIKAKEVLPGGVSSTARGSWVGWHPYPLFIGKGEGCRVFDVDGNEYIDYLLGLGPMLLGHRPKKVTKVVNEFIANQGTIFATPYSIEEEVARKMVEAVPCLEKVRFCSS